MKQGFTNHKCPRCGGNLYLDSNYYIEGGVIDWYEQVNCLQCGYIIYRSENPKTEIVIAATATQKELLPV